MCEKNDVNLVIVNSYDEMMFFGGLMKDNGGWNGFYLDEDGKILVWSSGEESDYQNWGKRGFKWQFKFQNCVYMLEKMKGFKWIMFRCFIKYKFICEKGKK